MSGRRTSVVAISALIASLVVLACTPTTPAAPCTFTANTAVTAYRLTEGTPELFGMISARETYEALARTAGG